jgi:hypothetical protein
MIGSDDVPLPDGGGHPRGVDTSPACSAAT